MKTWNVGDRVLARWFHDPFWYPATIREVDGERYYVKFDDGDKQWTPPGGGQQGWSPARRRERPR